MALKITRAHEPIEVKRIVTVIYGQPFAGKTTLGFMANKPLVLAFDPGVYRAKNRKDCVLIKTWEDIVSMNSSDLSPFETIVIDTAGMALDILGVDIIRRNPKMGYGSALALQGYGKLKGEFPDWLMNLKQMNLDVVLIAHASEDKNGDDIIERIDAKGKSKDVIYQAADLMGRIAIKNGKRMLYFSPTDTAFGKNPAQFPPLEVPDFNDEPCFLGRIIQETKDVINKQSTESIEVQEITDEWIVKFNDCVSAEEFNGLMDSVKKVDDRCALNVKRIMVKMAKEKKIGFDQDKAVFTDENA
jgi:hypothetical protein